MNHMKISTLGLVIGGFTLGGAAALGFVFWMESHSEGHATHMDTSAEVDMAGTDSQPHSMGQTYQAHDHHSMQISSEREYLTTMIAHHQEVVDTAVVVLEREGNNAEVVALVEDMVAVQSQEIETMKRWYEEWFGEEYAAVAYEPMMRDLEEYSGTELDRVFLEDMVEHHVGALMMSSSVQPHITNHELAGFVESIIATQRSEIEQIGEILLTL